MTDFAQVWNECRPMTEHCSSTAAYNEVKGCRVVPADSRLKIQGIPVARWNAVPVTDVDGKLVGVQLHPPHDDLTHKPISIHDADFGAGFCVLVDENLSGGTRAYVCVDHEDALACLCCGVLSSERVVTCLGIERMRTVATAIRERFPNMDIVLVPPRGSEALAQEVAREVDCGWVELPQDQPIGRTLDAILTALDDEGYKFGEKLLASPCRHKFRHLNAKQPAMEWLVPGVLPATGLACLYGASSSGKSFLALDLAAAVASGMQWFGRTTMERPVIYLALEGEAGWQQRLSAWQNHHGRGLSTKLKSFSGSCNLRSTENLRDLVAFCKASGWAAGLLVIDTLNRAAPGTDENSSRDMGDIIAACQQLQSALGGLVLLVHHSGKGAAKGLRGHSSLLAALDAAIEVTRDGERRGWAVVKAKDCADGVSHAFRLEAIQLAGGETSCVVLPVATTDAPERKPQPAAGNQRLIFDGLRELESAHRAETSAVGFAIGLETAVAQLRGRLECDPKRRSERARQAIHELCKKGLLTLLDGDITLSA